MTVQSEREIFEKIGLSSNDRRHLLEVLWRKIKMFNDFRVKSEVNLATFREVLESSDFFQGKPSPTGLSLRTLLLG